MNTQTKTFLSNQRCLVDGRPAYFQKYTHGGWKCSAYVCFGSDTSASSGNWKVQKNISLYSLSDTPW